MRPSESLTQHEHDPIAVSHTRNPGGTAQTGRTVEHSVHCDQAGFRRKSILACEGREKALCPGAALGTRRDQLERRFLGVAIEGAAPAYDHPRIRIESVARAAIKTVEYLLVPCRARRHGRLQREHRATTTGATTIAWVA